MRKFEIGDAVRLAHGKTRMVIVSMCRQKDGAWSVKAAYTKLPAEEAVRRYEKCPSNETFTSKRRNQDRFVAWDGPEIPTMNEYEVLTATHFDRQYGKHVATHKDGRFIIEFGDRQLEAFHAVDLKEVFPWRTFKVQSIRNCRASDYIRHYIGEQAKLDVGDMLLSEDGIIYRVVELDTRRRENEGVFKGKRILMEDF